MTEQVRVLFVDDDEHILNAVERMFTDDGYEILTAPSGEDGLALLEKSDPVHVIVSDYRMPGMNGVTFLSAVSRRWPDTVRMVLSGLSDTSCVVDAINEGGIFKYITKPWDSHELRLAVDNAGTLYFLQRRVTELLRELKVKDEEIARLQEALRRAEKERTLQ